MSKPTKQLHIDISKELHTQLKLTAVHRDQTLTELVVSALGAYLYNLENGHSPERVEELDDVEL